MVERHEAIYTNQDVEQVRVLTLNKGEHKDEILYRLKKGKLKKFCSFINL